MTYPLTCTITKAGRSNEFGVPFAVGDVYTGTAEYVSSLVGSGFATITDPAYALSPKTNAVGSDLSTLVFNDQSYASRNRQNVQAMLDRATSLSTNKVMVKINGDGVLWIDGPLFIGDNSSIETVNSAVIKQISNASNFIIGTKQLFYPFSNISVAWTSGKTATVTWTAHGCSINDAVVFQGVVGTTAADWFDIVRVVSVTDANTIVVRLNFIPSAAPSGQMTAKRCHRNVNINVNFDYNKTQNQSSAQANYARMGIVAAFLADSTVNVIGNDLYKYVLLVAGADNVNGSAVNYPTSNSDTLKYYGPIINCEFSAVGNSSEDCASFQAQEPSGFIAYMPCQGVIRGARLVNSRATVKTAGSGGVVVYGDSTYPIENLSIVGGRIYSENGTGPAFAIKQGVGFSAVQGLIRNIVVSKARIGATSYAAFEPTTYVDSVVFDASSFDAPDSASTRVIRIPNGANIGTIAINDMRFDGGAWPSSTGYFMEISNGAVVGDVVFNRCVIRGASSLRFMAALNGSSVKTVVFNDCDVSGIDTLASIQQSGITVIVRGGTYVNVLAAVSNTANCTVVIDGAPNFSGVTNGVIRTTGAGVVATVYGGSAPVISSGNLFVSVTSGAVNFKSDVFQFDIGATGVQKAAGNKGFNTGTGRGTIPQNVLVICDGTNWYNAANLAQTF